MKKSKVYESVNLDLSHDELKRLAKEVDERNIERYKSLQKLYVDWQKIASTYIDEYELDRRNKRIKTKLWCALQAVAPPTPFSWSNHVDHLIRAKENETEKIKAKEMDANKKADESLKTIKALAFLIERGYKLCSDGRLEERGNFYESGSFVKLANEIRFEEIASSLKKEGGFQYFSSNGSCENCQGWDMESPRCQCGNRRVGWESQGDFEDMHVFAEAY